MTQYKRTFAPGYAQMIANGAAVRPAAPSRSRPAPPPAIKEPVGASVDPQSCLFDRAVPQCLRKAYGLNGSHASATKFNAQTVVVNQGFKQTDLATFENAHGLPSQSVVKTVGTK